MRKWRWGESRQEAKCAPRLEVRLVCSHTVRGSCRGVRGFDTFLRRFCSWRYREGYQGLQGYKENQGYGLIPENSRKVVLVLLGLWKSTLP